MKRKKIKFTAGLLALAITVSMVPVTNYAKAAESEVRLAAVKEEKKVVKTVKGLKAALKDSSVKNIEVKSSKSLKISLKGSYTDVSIVFKTPNAVITNSGKFKAVTVRAKKWVEKADNNNLTIKSEKGQVVIDKAAETGTISVAKKDALLLLKINGSVKNVEVSKKADLRLSGKADKVSVEIKGEGTKLSSSLPVEVKVLKTASIELKSGAEGSRIEKLDEKAEVTVDNKSESEVSIVDAKGVESALESGKTQEIKEEEKAENTQTEEEAALNTQTDQGTGGVTEVYGTADESRYAPIEDEKLLKVINKNIDPNRADNQRVTKEELGKLTALSLFLDENGKPHFSEDFMISEDKSNGKVKESILGVPKDLSGTSEFKFAVSRGIKSIKGLEYAVNLEKIKLNENEIKDITPLRNLKKLKYIELQRNRIVDIEPLKDLTELEYLKLYNNLIEDVTPLAKLTKLKGLDLHYNVTVGGSPNNKIISKGITDISVIIENLRELVFLDVSANRIGSIRGLENLNKIKDLDLSGNNISDYTGLGEYISERLLKMYGDSPEGSINFYSQTVDFGGEVEVSGGKAEFKMPYKGIAEVTEKLAEAFEDDSYRLFAGIKVKGYDEISAVYNQDTGKIVLTVPASFAEANKDREIYLSLEISDSSESFGWLLNGIRLSFAEDEFSIPEQYEAMYKRAIGLTRNSSNPEPFDNYVLTKEDMLKIRSFSIMANEDVTDSMLAPLKWADNLEEFVVTVLKGRRLAKNLSVVLDKPGLKKFCYINNGKEKDTLNISSFDFAGNELEDFRVTDADIESLEFLKDQTNLKELVADDCKIANLQGIENLSKLERLEVSGNRISEPGDLSKLTSLKTLYLKGNPVTSISGIENVRSLRAVIMDSTEVEDISALAELPLLLRAHVNGANLSPDYMQVIRRLSRTNTLGLGKISQDDFNWLKEHSARAEDDNLPADVDGEDDARSIDFKDLELEYRVSKSGISGNKIVIDNRLTDWDGTPIVQADSDEEQNPVDQNDRLTFRDDKIELSYNGENNITESYNILIEHSSLYFGQYSMAPLLKGKVTLKIIVEDTPAMEVNGIVPRRFDLRAQSAVTAVKNQFRDGGCRSFAALGALESHIKLKTGEELDLSENNFENRHGFYFRDARGNEAPIRSGRNRNSDISYLINNGPVLEEKDPYIPMKGDGGQENYLTQEEVNAGALRSRTITEAAKQIMGFEFLKTVDISRVDNPEAEVLLQIKEAVKNYGGVVTDMYMAHDGNRTFPFTDEKYYNTETYGYYADGNDSERAYRYAGAGNHAVVIVGWDDDYSKTNFRTQPDIDGAWIVKDAQGETFGDGGYFYVSYKSVSMGENPYVFTEVINPAYKIYQHDDLAFTGFMTNDFFEDGQKAVLFNRYVPVAGTKLEKIGFYTTKPNAEYEVYLIPEFDSFTGEVSDDYEEYYNEIQQYKIASGIQSKAGYHTVEIAEDKKLEFASGAESFAIGIWTKNKNAEDREWDMVLEKKDTMKEGKNAKVGKRETYAFTFDGFMDLNQFTVEKNVCIKGYYTSN